MFFVYQIEAILLVMYKTIIGFSIRNFVANFTERTK